jgi:hypothetical protein
MKVGVQVLSVGLQTNVRLGKFVAISKKSGASDKDEHIQVLQQGIYIM